MPCVSVVVRAVICGVCPCVLSGHAIERTYRGALSLPLGSATPLALSPRGVPLGVLLSRGVETLVVVLSFSPDGFFGAIACTRRADGAGCRVARAEMRRTNSRRSQVQKNKVGRRCRDTPNKLAKYGWPRRYMNAATGRPSGPPLPHGISP